MIDITIVASQLLKVYNCRQLWDLLFRGISSVPVLLSLSGYQEKNNFMLFQSNNIRFLALAKKLDREWDTEWFNCYVRHIKNAFSLFFYTCMVSTDTMNLVQRFKYILQRRCMFSSEMQLRAISFTFISPLQQGAQR